MRAGLAILDAIGTLKASPGVPLQARVGIATGLVVVGEQLVTADMGSALRSARRQTWRRGCGPRQRPAG